MLLHFIGSIKAWNIIISYNYCLNKINAAKNNQVAYLIFLDTYVQANTQITKT